MSYLCLTLPEAARTLDMSETILVRLSQYFRIPQDAFDEIGALSFKGDLMFSEPDLDFFRQVKGRIVAGETLDQIKERLRPRESQPATAVPPAQSPEFLQALNTLYSEAPQETAAENMLARYRQTHHPQPAPRVFETLSESLADTLTNPPRQAEPDSLPPSAAEASAATPPQPTLPPIQRVFGAPGTGVARSASWQVSRSPASAFNRPSLRHAGLQQAAKQLQQQFISHQQ